MATARVEGMASAITGLLTAEDLLRLNSQGIKGELIRGILSELKTDLMLGERMATATTELLTAEDLLRLNSQGVKGELIRGVLCETVSAGAEHSFIAGNILSGLHHHVRPRRLGRVGGTDGGVLIQRDPATVREPDVYYISAEKLPLDVRVQGYLEVMPELVVEIVSPSDRGEAVNDKTLMWLTHGVMMVVEVYPAEQAVMVHRSGFPPITLTGDDVLEVEDVLPGFSLPLSEIFDA